MTGCLSCGGQHTGSCDPQHPEHRPLTAKEWAEREERAASAEKDISPDGWWETLKDRASAMFSRDDPEPRRGYDLETPGPTEAAGGSFQVVATKAEAERVAASLPPSQEVHIDRVHDANGPTDSYAVSTLPSPAEVARNPAVEERIAQLEDPADRERAQALLEALRSEVAAQERPREREQERGIELER